jgi:hypothetical protein
MMGVKIKKTGKANRTINSPCATFIGLGEIERDVVSQEKKDNTHKLVSSMA